MLRTNYTEVVEMNRARKFCAVIFSLVFIVAFNPPLPVSAADGTTVVYVTKTGEKYHADGCRYLKKSKIEKSLEDAVAEGYEPCSKCSPPEL
jgi:hypothetical protein